MAPRNTDVLAERFQSLCLTDLRVLLAALEGPGCTSERAADLYYAVKQVIDAKEPRRGVAV